MSADRVERMKEYDRQYIYIICAVLYCIAVSLGASAAEMWLTPPRTALKASMCRVPVRSGDVVLWSSQYKLRTDVEKLLCGSKYTHVGLIFVDRAGTPWVWEAVVTGHRVQRLHTVLKKAQGRENVYLRKISTPLNPVALETYIRHNIQKPYSFNLWRAVIVRWCDSLHLPASSDNSARFCSQLVADTYHHLGVLDFRNESKETSHVLPGDFGSSRSDLLPWTRGYGLGPEIELFL
jgi:hypothetical protein